MDVRGTLKEALARLRRAEVPSPTLAAELLLMHALDRDRAWLYAHPEESLDEQQAEEYLRLVTRRVAGTPTQYLTGKQEFWGLEFEVTPAVLIPRPETEHVIEVALERVGHEKSSGRLRVADVGTGCGCLAVALASELPHAQVFATDISAAALEIARRNARRHGLAGRIEFLHGNLLAPLLSGRQDSSQVRFDLMVSNPPYVGRREADMLPREVRAHEPGEALFAGERGAEVYPPLVRQAEQLLAPGGSLVVEIGYDVLRQVRTLVENRLCWTRIALTNDLAGIPRVISAERA